ncbi:AGAP013481-PD [Anopheles gambiae str. PEST]|uniref:AGAP013481-PD n=1 Tax=Anopheles gambiae TaxID=7165 RepID=F5HK66_ANOGA|nr:AGAP013481-PD [Anopheles gambiae str. PEST]
MVYESDFYSTRRVGSSYTRPTISSYTVTRRGVDWDKVPFVPRPSLIPDPVTAYGKRQPRKEARVSILETINREGIEPDPRILARPIDQYRSPRDLNRQRIANELHRREYNRATGHTTDADNVDTLLRRVHGTAPVKEGRRHVMFFEPGYARTYYRH